MTHFDAIIVGTGFGGSVAAWRLAEAGKSVLVLERGKAYPPGSFPRSPAGVKKNFWDPSEGLYGMYNVWSFRDIEALVSSGLGGGSLIYANVLLRKDEKWFVREDPAAVGWEYWPVTRAELDPHYDRVEPMLNAQPYPSGAPPFDRTAKTLALGQAARNLEQHPEFAGQVSYELPPLAVSFRAHPYDPNRPNDPQNPPVVGAPIPGGDSNLHGSGRQTCRLCGECDIGCNYGSKNTLDFNFLTAADAAGAQIRTGCEVTTFRQKSAGYEVSYRELDFERRSRHARTRTLTCDRLILAAGTLGTTFLMLANRQRLPGLQSRRLGERFSGNGDLLSIALRSNREMDPSFGPVITSYVRVSDTADGGTGRGFYIEDAGYPHFLNWIVQAAGTGLSIGTHLQFAWRWIRLRLGLSTDSDLGAEISDLIGSTRTTSASLPLLGMGRDIADGRMQLSEGRLDVDWSVATSRTFFDRMELAMETIAESWGARFIVNPSYRHFNRLITVHPLGGCPMGRSPEEGVVDARGEVFGCPGLFIVDGSVMPGPVGANPALTIAALSDRFCDRMLED